MPAEFAVPGPRKKQNPELGSSVQWLSLKSHEQMLHFLPRNVSWLVEAGQVGSAAPGWTPVGNSRGPSLTCLR